MGDGSERVLGWSQYQTSCGTGQLHRYSREGLRPAVHCKNELTLTVLLHSDAFKVVGRNQRVRSLTVSSITRQPAPPEGQILTRGPGPAVLVRVLDDVLRGLSHGAPLSWSINGQKENYELLNNIRIPQKTLQKAFAIFKELYCSNVSIALQT